MSISDASRSTLSPRDAAKLVLSRLRERGFEAYFAGGCVRDELLGLHPADYDIATSARPQDVQRIFAGTHAVGAAFGVVLVPLPREARDGAGKGVIEVATFRADGEYTDKRRPDSVRFSSAREDALRRDFTINALFLDPLTPGPNPLIDGVVIDFVNGQQDLDARVLRAVGDPDARLNEDHLRALRAARFAARLGMQIDDATARVIKRHARELAGVSRERIGEELRKMLLHPARAAAAALVCDLGMETVALGGSESPPSGAGASAWPCLRALPPRLWPGATVASPLAAWLIDRAIIADDALGDPTLVVSRLKRDLALSNDEAAELRGTLVAVHAIRAIGSAGWVATSVAARKRLLVERGVVGAITLLHALDQPLAETVTKDLTSLATDGIGLAPPPRLTGDILITRGMSPGPAFKRLLDEAYTRQLSGSESYVDKIHRV